MSRLLALLPSWVPVAAAIVLVLALIGGGFALYHSVYTKGEKAGAAEVTTKVQTETIKAGEAARINREKVEDEVRRTPYDDRADGLR